MASRRRPVASIAPVVALVATVSVALALSAGGGAGYRVREGDTLADVAARYGTSVRALAQANGIRDIHTIYAGSTLDVPRTATSSAKRTSKGTAPVAASYVVRKGDNLASIAVQFGTSQGELERANKLRNRNHVEVGQRLVVPGPAAPVAGRTTAGKGLPERLRQAPSRLALMPLMDRWARTYGVPPDLLKATTWLESGWQNSMVSSVGARGIGQLMPDTVDFVSSLLGTRLKASVPEHNVRMSARFLRYLLDQNGGSSDRALASYYQGLRSVRQIGMLPETKQYVTSIQALRPRFR